MQFIFNIYDNIGKWKNYSFIKSAAQNQYLQCPLCKKEISYTNYARHLKEMHDDENEYQCPNCPYSTTRKDNMERHTTTYCPAKERPG